MYVDPATSRRSSKKISEVEIANSLKIIDFGLAQFVNEDKYIYVHVGTPGFVAPEILANESN